MGIINDAIQRLKDGGVRAERAYPGKNRVVLTGVAAAVQLQSMDADTASVLVNVLSPVAMGAAACEDAAISICQLLKAAGASCTVGQSGYLADAEVFCVPVTAEFAGKETDGVWTPATEPAEPEKLVFSVTLGGVALGNAVSFTAQRATDEMVTQLDSALWTFTLEEAFPLDGTEEAAPEEPFTIIVTRQGRTETYTGCTLTQQRRILTEEGLRQIRTGIAGAVTVS